jgi:hypothetical protein
MSASSVVQSNRLFREVLDRLATHAYVRKPSVDEWTVYTANVAGTRWTGRRTLQWARAAGAPEEDGRWSWASASASERARSGRTSRRGVSQDTLPNILYKLLRLVGKTRVLARAGGGPQDEPARAFPHDWREETRNLRASCPEHPQVVEACGVRVQAKWDVLENFHGVKRYEDLNYVFTLLDARADARAPNTITTHAGRRSGPAPPSSNARSNARSSTLR